MKRDVQKSGVSSAIQLLSGFQEFANLLGREYTLPDRIQSIAEIVRKM